MWRGSILALLYAYTSRFIFADAACNVGVPDVSSYTSQSDQYTGYQYVIPASVIPCCGVLSAIKYYPVESGNIYFQIWRPTSLGTYELTGRFLYFNGYVNTTVTFSVDEDISVRKNDVIGWYTPGADQIPFSTGSTLNQENTLLSGYGVLSEGFSLTLASVYVTDRTYAVQYQISDSQSPSFKSFTTTLNIYDTISTGTIVQQLSATDPDDQDIVDLTFSLKNKNPTTAPFKVTNSGAVQTTSIPSVGSYTLVVRVQDSCNKNRDKTMYINVINQAPEFLNLPASVDIHESTVVETLLYTLSVIDQSGTDTISCSINSSSPTNAPFMVKYKSGSSDYGIYLLANAGLDFSKTSRYDLSISCADSKDTTTETLSVYVLNSHPSVIHNLPDSITISSHTTAGSILFTVNATDQDNDVLVYSIQPCNPCPFSITSAGHVLLKESILTALIYSYAMTVLVSDGSSNTVATLAILVSDVNNKPFFSNLDNHILVPETAIVGSTVFTVTVIDSDVTDTLTYQVTYEPSDAADKFTFDVNTGKINVKSVLDYESGITVFNITLTVSDGKNPSDPGTLQIVLMDMNEPPIFDRPVYHVTKDECCIGHDFPDPGYYVTDPDGDVFSYDFGSGSDDHTRFFINGSNGRMKYATNYDIDAPNFMPSNLIFIIKVTDIRGQSSTASLSVTITDRSDYTPSFDQSLYSKTIYNNLVTSSSVLYVTATDQDYGPTCNAITYTITTTADYFSIDSTGLVRTTRDLTSFLNETTLNFTLEARDGCNRYSDTLVKITIQPGYSYGFFDNPVNVAIAVAAFMASLALVAVIIVLLYRFCRYGYIFKKGSCFSRNKMHRNTAQVSDLKQPKLKEKEKSLPSPEIQRNNTRTSAISPLPWSWDDWKVSTPA